MEKDTVLLSIKRYEELTRIERELKDNKTVIVRKQIYIPSSLWYQSYPSTLDDSVEFYFLTESEIIETLSEEVNSLIKELDKRDSTIKSIISQIRELRSNLKNLRYSKVDRIIDDFYKKVGDYI